MVRLGVSNNVFIVIFGSIFMESGCVTLLGKTQYLTTVSKSYLCMHAIYKVYVKISGYYLAMQVLQLNFVLPIKFVSYLCVPKAFYMKEHKWQTILFCFHKSSSP